ncbi:hypothetical protein [Pedobacter gandavensis]|uniref:Uncharacterized protein n=1 Tax=Pedobacter gandavensis TaxID=2679963 RepID=A0ABR6EYX5_9SPHI|nr:hypothetical protein [Pedobacter gandavensis]MBB2150465.1 hypothetical protein [Pedobacter gandavensis]
MLKLILKTLSKEFYGAHAGLFLFGFYLAFGVVEGGQLLSYHKTLMLMVYASPLILGAVYCFWALYLLKCFLFIRKQLKMRGYHFVFLLGATTRKDQFKLWFKTYLVLFLPILGYIIPFCYVGLTEGYYIGVLTSVSFVFIVLSLVSGYMYRIINYSHVPVKVYFSFPCPQLKKPYWTWPLYSLVMEQTLMLFLSKILSFSLFSIVMWVFADVPNDGRVALIGILAAVLAHSMVIQVLLKQERDQLAFNKSLPIKLTTRMGQTLLVFLMLFLPEILFYLRSVAGDVQSFFVGFLFGLAGLMGLRMVLYWIKLDLDRYFKWLLGFFFISMFVILSGYAISFSLLMLTAYFLYFYCFYYRIDLQEV